MKTLLNASHYNREDIFTNEKNDLFEKTWQFAGFTDELNEHQDYLCTVMAGKTVVLMNFKGKIKAFHNVCSHRQNKICLKDAGNGPLQCQYHGWTYNEDGYPYAIPNKKNFSELNLENLKLTEYDVESVGRFIFIKTKEKFQCLSDYLGKTYLLLEQIGSAMGEKIDKNEMTIDANWKIVVENTLEDYHVRMVHPESLNTVGINERVFIDNHPHSSTTLKFDLDFYENKKISSAFMNRPLHINDYLHLLIFPNLTLASAYGTTFSLQQIIPLTSGKTKFISHVFSTKLQNEASASVALINSFYNSAKDFNRRVFDEDKFICEQVHMGLMEAGSKHGVLCEDEKRVHGFQKAYLEYLIC